MTEGRVRIVPATRPEQVEQARALVLEYVTLYFELKL